MMTIFRIFLKNAVRDVYLLFWSILLPLGMLIGLGLYFNTPEYHVRLLAGVIGTSALFWALETTVFYILKQRNRGVYKLLRVTPMKIFFVYYCLDLSMDGSISGRSYHPAYWGAGAIRHQDAVWDFADLLCNAGDCNHMLYFNKLCSG